VCEWNFVVFGDGSVKVFVVIDIVVRGIYVDDVNFVVYVDLLVEYKVYIYWLGCMVRVGVKGVVVMFMIFD